MTGPEPKRRPPGELKLQLLLFAVVAAPVAAYLAWDLGQAGKLALKHPWAQRRGAPPLEHQPYGETHQRPRNWP